jgi:putative DNA-invertase from lambdoid prophage Rac
VAAKAKGVALGLRIGQRPSDKKAKKVLFLHGEGLSYRLIARNVGLSKNTVMEIVRREAARATLLDGAYQRHQAVRPLCFRR